ncbi:unnamed protein product [Schistosoma mattheei]|uniref:Uncharacterized protein n=1 Tax=Schistosoma mattheei TaxID=31246 RepID=A0A3P8JWS3_9TREM|nr:unnamed protein product [Schistosoma mattheei]
MCNICLNIYTFILKTFRGFTLYNRFINRSLNIIV